MTHQTWAVSQKGCTQFRLLPYGWPARRSATLAGMKVTMMPCHMKAALTPGEVRKLTSAFRVPDPATPKRL